MTPSDLDSFLSSRKSRNCYHNIYRFFSFHLTSLLIQKLFRISSLTSRDGFWVTVEDIEAWGSESILEAMVRDVKLIKKSYHSDVWPVIGVGNTSTSNRICISMFLSTGNKILIKIRAFVVCRLPLP